jgi:hypothetical protein
MLVIACDTHPLFKQLKIEWRKNLHPSVKTIFIQYSPNVDKTILVDDDTLFLPGTESFEAITRKTVESIEYFLQDSSFTHVIRSNLSSVWHFPRLIEYLETREKTGLFTGIIGYIDENAFVSGAGIHMSRDVAELLVKYKEKVYTYNLQDDLAMSYALHDVGVNITPSQNRIDLITPELFHSNKNRIPNSIHHFRLKQVGDRSLEPEFMREIIELITKNDLEMTL